MELAANIPPLTTHEELANVKRTADLNTQIVLAVKKTLASSTLNSVASKRLHVD
jgi:hypothetical protein